MTTLGLTMIVKNEAHVIVRALESVRPLIDYAVIADTGSTDGTQDVITTWLRENGVPGEVIERPWVDFAHNRNEVIAALRERPEIDYGLTIDADEYFTYSPRFDASAFKSTLSSADGWRVPTQERAHVWFRVLIFSNRLLFRFRYLVHEQMTAPEGATIGTVTELHDVSTIEGARSKSGNKYLRDARICEEALEAETDPEAIRRYTYYIAQGYRDGGELAKARDVYLERTTLGGAQDEIAMSYFYAGYAMEKLGDPVDGTLAMYLKARELAPLRGEPLWAAARVANRSGRHQLAYDLSSSGIGLKPPDVFAYDLSVYEWRMLDEFQIACCGIGRLGEAVEASEQLLAEAKFPPSHRARIEQNAASALAGYDALAAAAVNPTTNDP